MSSPAFAPPNLAHCPLQLDRRPLPSTSRCHRTSRWFAATSRPTTSKALVEEFWSLSNTGSFSSTSHLFSPSAVYVDTLYPSPFKGLPKISKHLVNMESAIPPGLVFVLDDLAPAENSVGARWHVETKSGKQLPLSRGASMYRVEPAGDGLGGMWITEAWDFVETPFKVAGLILPLLRAVGFVLRATRSERK